MPKERVIIDYAIIWKKINQSPLSSEEEALLSQWLSVNPSHRSYFDKIVRYHLEGSGFEEDEIKTEKAWKLLKTEVVKKKFPVSRWIISLSVASCLIVFILYTFIPVKTKVQPGLAKAEKTGIIRPGKNQATLILDDGSVLDLGSSQKVQLKEGDSEIKIEGSRLQYTGNSNNAREIKYNTLNVPRGGEYFLVLSDGTKVWLNSETTLRYPVEFTENERKVELLGEAFFEVARNEKVPFLVQSGEQIVKVLGTEFNISCYKENVLMYTTLVKGSVEVFIKDMPACKQTLKPNEQSSISKAGGQICKHTVDPYPYVAWKDGRFVFDDKNLGEIMNMLSKWYDIEVVFTREDLKNIRFTGNLPRYSDFNEILSKISKTNEVKFKIETKRVIIS